MNITNEGVAQCARLRSLNMSLDDLAAIGVTSPDTPRGAEHHGCDTPFHSDRSGKRRPYRAGQDRAPGGDPLDRLNLGGRALAWDVLPPRMAPGRGGQPCLA